MSAKPDVYDDYAAEYADMIAQSEQAGFAADPFLPHLLEIIGDVAGLRVLDAGCGEGYVARILAQRGAVVTAIDIATRLIHIAQSKAFANVIDYRTADLSQGLPEDAERFDLVVSHFVLNDVENYQGFITTLGAVMKHGGRLVIGMNNPYSYVVRNHLDNYFAAGTAHVYPGMAEQGVRVHFYQRTLADYLDAFLANGLQLQRLIDVPTPASILNKKTHKLLPPGYQFPYYMILCFQKP